MIFCFVKETVLNFVLLNRFHFGTVCHGSSILSFLRIFQIFYKDWYRSLLKFPNSADSLLSDISKFFLIISPRVFTLCSYVTTIQDGTDYYTSAKKVFNIARIKPINFIVLAYVSQSFNIIIMKI